MIQGFNQEGKWAIGMIRLEFVTSELSSNMLFHVIDVKTSYNVLLGQPWLHENGVIPSTLHQCFKFYKRGVKKVEVDTKPFTVSLTLLMPNSIQRMMLYRKSSFQSFSLLEMLNLREKLSNVS